MVWGVLPLWSPSSVMPSPSPARYVILATFLGVVVIAIAFARVRYLPCGFSGRCPAGAVLPGVRVDGEPVPKGVMLRAFVQERVDALRARRVNVTAPGDPSRIVDEASLGDLGLDVDVDRVVARALSVGRDDDLLTQAQTAERARRGGIDVSLDPTVDARTVIDRFAPLKEE